jgi:hypothetical protein
VVSTIVVPPVPSVGPEVADGMIIHLVANLVTPIDAVLLPHLTILGMVQKGVRYSCRNGRAPT